LHILQLLLASTGRNEWPIFVPLLVDNFCHGLSGVLSDLIWLYTRKDFIMVLAKTHDTYYSHW
jgi:hypothetical protein